MLTNCLPACARLTITVSEIQRDICEKVVVILSYPLHSTPPLGVFPSEYQHPLWDGKTRMMSLPDGKKISKISLFVLTWSTNVTDRRTLDDSKDRAVIKTVSCKYHGIVDIYSASICLCVWRHCAKHFRYSKPEMTSTRCAHMSDLTWQVGRLYVSLIALLGVSAAKLLHVFVPSLLH